MDRATLERVCLFLDVAVEMAGAGASHLPGRNASDARVRRAAFSRGLTFTKADHEAVVAALVDLGVARRRACAATSLAPFAVGELAAALRGLLRALPETADAARADARLGHAVARFGGDASAGRCEERCRSRKQPAPQRAAW